MMVRDGTGLDWHRYTDRLLRIMPVNLEKIFVAFSRKVAYNNIRVAERKLADKREVYKRYYEEKGQKKGKTGRAGCSVIYSCRKHSSDRYCSNGIFGV